MWLVIGLGLGAGVAGVMAWRELAPRALDHAPARSATSSSTSPTVAQLRAGPVDELLARVFLAELGGAADSEAAYGAIWHAAQNRARAWSADVRAVLLSQVPGRREWGSGCAGGSCAYNRSLAELHRRPQWGAMLRLARRAVAGELPNVIGRRRQNFLHPLNAAFAVDRSRSGAGGALIATGLRAQAAGALAAGAVARARALYQAANRAADYPKRDGREVWAWSPRWRRVLPIWAVAHNHGGEADPAAPPLDIGARPTRAA